MTDVGKEAYFQFCQSVVDVYFIPHFQHGKRNTYSSVYGSNEDKYIYTVSPPCLPPWWQNDDL